jgi:hypothetical protein
MCLGVIITYLDNEIGEFYYAIIVIWNSLVYLPAISDIKSDRFYQLINWLVLTHNYSEMTKRMCNTMQLLLFDFGPSISVLACRNQYSERSFSPNLRWQHLRYYEMLVTQILDSSQSIIIIYCHAMYWILHTIQSMSMYCVTVT